MKAKFLFGIAMSTLAFLSCDDTTDTLGNSLTNEADHFEILTDTFLSQHGLFWQTLCYPETNTATLGALKTRRLGRM